MVLHVWGLMPENMILQQKACDGTQAEMMHLPRFEGFFAPHPSPCPISHFRSPVLAMGSDF
uniref:Uncharacterized protein n=1 Tax=Triticum urartu TaxID=4572 RepID=A0A8R7R6A5_TRIUA